MKRLWIADVHANLPALEAVLAAAGEMDEVIFLGDIVGCGPHPAECVDRLRGLNARAVMGNHDTAVLSRRERPAAVAPPGDWDQWTFERLDATQLNYLAALPETMTVSAWRGQVTARHCPPGAPYLHPAMPDRVLTPHFAALPAEVVCCGHSHRPLDRTLDGRRLVILPSVGQPRNGDPRASYALERSGLLTFHAVPYDVERVVADLRAIGLPQAFRERWIRFVRTGFDAEWSREYEGEQ